MSTAKNTAAAFLSRAHELGFTVSTREQIVTVSASFRPGDRSEFVRLDMQAPGLLRMLGARGGSVWGTDGGSVGGAVALNRGEFALNASGVPKRVCSEILRRIEDVSV